MKYSRLLSFLLTLCLPFSGILSPLLAGEELRPPRLVRFHDLTRDELVTMLEAGVDFVAAGKGWHDAIIPAVQDMQLAEFQAMDVLLQTMPAPEVILENADDSFAEFKDLEDAGIYHTWDEVNEELDAIAAAHPDITHLEAAGTSVEGREIRAIRITSAPEGEKPAFLFTGCHHAREWISVEVPMGIINWLVDGYGSDPAVTNLVDNREIWVIPVVNPDGLIYSQTQYKMWRKNRRHNSGSTYGVDVNRNYGYKWGGVGSSGSPSSDTYRGPSAFSEPETRLVRDIAQAKGIVSAISFHSYSQLVLWPWGYTDQPSPDADVFSRIGHKLAEFNGYRPIQSVNLYPTTGDFDDFMYGELGILSYTFELGTVFVPPEDQVQPIIQKNIPAVKWFLENAADPFPPLRHAELPATTDPVGPFGVAVETRAQAAATIATVTMVYSVPSSDTSARVVMTRDDQGQFRANIPGDGYGEYTYHFEATTVSGGTLREPSEGSYSFRVVDRLVLIVDDDRKRGYEAAYQNSLDSLTEAYSTWETDTRGTPPASTLQAASAVIWFTGEDSASTLTDDEQAVLTEYLANGGRLMLFGQDIGYDIKSSDFYKDTLKARFEKDTSPVTELTGAAGSFGEGLALQLNGPSTVRQKYPEVIGARQGATPLFTYDGTETLGAIAVDAETYRLAYFGFGLEGITGDEARGALLSKGLEWLAGSAGAAVARHSLVLGSPTASNLRGSASELSHSVEGALKALEQGRRQDAEALKSAAERGELPASAAALRDLERRLRYEQSLAQD